MCAFRSTSSSMRAYLLLAECVERRKSKSESHPPTWRKHKVQFWYEFYGDMRTADDGRGARTLDRQPMNEMNANKKEQVFTAMIHCNVRSRRNNKLDSVRLWRTRSCTKASMRQFKRNFQLIWCALRVGVFAFVAFVSYKLKTGYRAAKSQLRKCAVACDIPNVMTISRRVNVQFVQIAKYSSIRTHKKATVNGIDTESEMNLNISIKLPLFVFPPT